MPANKSLSVEEKLDLVLERVEEIALKQASMSEILLAWNNAKGFVKTIQGISKILRWLVLTGGAFAAVWFLLINGHWPKG